ncbi:MAG: sulfur carrier protein ThiS [Chitinivibrionia bacterium]|nr:sulfur carrier protein ThiS [Chitinivibrionia bacterium]
MKCKINATETDITSKTVGDLLRERDILFDTVVIEYNGEILKRVNFDEKVINDGDNIEILSFVGGG